MIKILIVDDEIEICEGLKFKLLQANLPDVYEDSIRSVHNIDDALKNIKTNKPDVVLLDIILENTTGLELLSRLNGIYPLNQIIVVSGHSDYKYVQRAFKMGVIDYLIKPIEIENLRNVIDEVVSIGNRNRRKSHDELAGVKLLHFVMEEGGNSKASKDISRFVMKYKFRIAEVIVKDDYSENTIEKNIAEFLNNEEIHGYALVKYGIKHYLLLLYAPSADELERNIQLIMKMPPFMDMKYERQIRIAICADENLNKVRKSINELSQIVKIGNVSAIRGDTLNAPIKKQTLERTLLEFKMALKAHDLNKAYGIIHDVFAGAMLAAQPVEVIYFLYKGLLEATGTFLTGEALAERYNEFVSEEDLELDLKLRSNTCVMADNNSNYQFMSRVIEYFNNNIEKNPSMAEVANQLNYSYAYFSRMFKEKIGIGFADFVFFQKMNQAEKLLREGFNVNEVSKKIGYGNPKNFSRAFRKYYGSTPSEYIKMR